MTRFTERINRFRGRLEAAARAAEREPGEIRLVAVSKRHPAARVQSAMDCGLSDFGENYLQDALPKIHALGDRPVWHYIGQVQSNKTRPIAEHFDWVQTVTSLRQARRLSEQRPADAKELQICLQLAPSGSDSRSGVPSDELESLTDAVVELPHLRLRGLMILPLPQSDPDRQRAEFARVRRLYESLNDRGFQLDTLSMGMSDDLEAAIMEGSTMIRIGTAIFGPRDTEAGKP